MKAHHAVARPELCDVAAGRNYRAGEFVAENLRRFNVALENFLDVRAADSTSGNFDEDFVVADFRDGDFFDADNSLFTVDTRAHSFGNGAESLSPLLQYFWRRHVHA